MIAAADGTLPRLCPVCRAPGFQARFEQVDLLHGIGGHYTVVVCRGCGLASYEPFPEAGALASLYPADYYARRLPDDDDNVSPRARLRRFLDDLYLGLRLAPIRALLLSPLLWFKRSVAYAHFLRGIPHGRLLDVGCGDGAFLLKAHRMGFTCEGLEPGAEPNPALARRGIALHAMPLEEFPLPAIGYDIITLHHVFEHLPDPESALLHLRALLAPTGRLLIRMPRTDHFQFRRPPHLWFNLDLPRHLYLYTPENFGRLAARCGLRVERVETEMNQVHLRLALKARLFGRRFADPHWSDRAVFDAAFLPLCALLKRAGQADMMAIWLRPR